MTDIGDVLADNDRPAVPLGVPPDQVREQERPHVAEVGEPVHGRPARVQAQLPAPSRRDFHHAALPGVVETEHACQPSNQGVRSDGGRVKRVEPVKASQVIIAA